MKSYGQPERLASGVSNGRHGRMSIPTPWHIVRSMLASKTLLELDQQKHMAACTHTISSASWSPCWSPCHNDGHSREEEGREAMLLLHMIPSVAGSNRDMLTITAGPISQLATREMAS